MSLIYRPGAPLVENLAVGECTIHRAGNDAGAKWWLLWFYVPRDTDGAPEVFAVPVNPGGSYTESGPGGRTWGLTRTGPDTWQVAPSINVLDSHEAHPGEHAVPSLWHKTPAIVGVPAGEPWAA